VTFLRDLGFAEVRVTAHKTRSSALPFFHSRVWPGYQHHLLQRWSALGSGFWAERKLGIKSMQCWCWWQKLYCSTNGEPTETRGLCLSTGYVLQCKFKFGVQFQRSAYSDRRSGLHASGGWRPAASLHSPLDALWSLQPEL
jgi:hypothetical protein